jgi:CDP-diacylglycerol--glycerol-3-phosphate 3-phosphatidyltransferase
MALSSVISYMRAKAESLGLDAKGGLMERAERIIALCIGLLFPSILIPILWITLGLTAITAVQRFVKVWKQAAVAQVTADRLELRRSRRQSRRVVRIERRRTRIARTTGRVTIRRD